MEKVEKIEDEADSNVECNLNKNLNEECFDDEETEKCDF